MGDRKWSAASDRLVRLLTSKNGANPAFMVFYIEQLIQHDELDKATFWTDRLASIEPNSLRMTASKARLLKAKKKEKEAQQLLRADATRNAKEPARQLGLARLMESLDFPEDAEKAYRAHADLRATEPRSQVPLIAFLGRRDRVKEALQACERIKGKVPDELLAELAVNVLRDGTPTEEQCRWVIGWLQEARKKNADRSVFDLALANISDLLGNPDEAVAYYRDLLKRDERNLLAYNNLAVLLALREGKHDEALENIDKALALAGQQPDLLDTKGIVLLAANKPTAAIEVLDQATQMTPDAASLFRLARAHLLAKNERLARAVWIRAKAEGFKLSSLHPLERDERAEDDGPVRRDKVTR